MAFSGNRMFSMQHSAITKRMLEQRREREQIAKLAKKKGIKIFCQTQYDEYRYLLTEEENRIKAKAAAKEATTLAKTKTKIKTSLGDDSYHLLATEEPEQQIQQQQAEPPRESKRSSFNPFAGAPKELFVIDSGSGPGLEGYQLLVDKEKMPIRESKRGGTYTSRSDDYQLLPASSDDLVVTEVKIEESVVNEMSMTVEASPLALSASPADIEISCSQYCEATCCCSAESLADYQRFMKPTDKALKWNESLYQRSYGRDWREQLVTLKLVDGIFCKMPICVFSVLNGIGAMAGASCCFFKRQTKACASQVTKICKSSDSDKDIKGPSRIEMT